MEETSKNDIDVIEIGLPPIKVNKSEKVSKTIRNIFQAERIGDKLLIKSLESWKTQRMTAQYGSSPLDESSDDYDNDNNGIQVTKRPRSVADSTLHDFYDKINLPLGKKEIDQLLNQLNGEHQPSSFDVSSANLLDIEVASINLKIEKLHAL
ncbi:4369_t:CDS:2, partial [Entrophospora sp. SA101]